MDKSPSILMHKEPARLSIKELSQLKWLMGSVLSLLSLWALWALDFQLELYVLAGAGVTIFAMLAPGRVARLSPRFWRMTGFGLLLVILADFVMSVPRTAEFLPPLVRMVILLLIYRCLAPRRRREDLQLILLCLFCLVLSGVLTLSLLFGLQILLFMPLTMGLLFILCLLRSAGDPEVVDCFGDDFSIRSLIGRVRRVADYKFLAFGGLLFACMVGISSGLFVLIPRFNLDQAIPFMQLSSQAMSGFSSDVRLGNVSAIREDRRIALQVDVPSFDSMVGRPYWRMLVLDQYSNGYFRVSSELETRQFQDYKKERNLPGWERWRVPYTEREDRVWTFFLEGSVSEYLPLPGPFASIRFPNLQELYHNETLLTLQTPLVQQSVFSYQLYDMQWTDHFPATDLEQKWFAENKPFVVDFQSEERYPSTTLSLDLSDSDLSYLEEVNSDLLGESLDLSARAYGQRVIRWLRRGHSYSLNPNESFGDGDPVVRWMRSDASGHCEYFAGAMILLARAAGYPARMAVGFHGGSWNSVESYFVVRNSDAHAWVELYDAKLKQWVRMDPTPGNGEADTDQSLESQILMETGWSAWVDSLRMQWYRRVVNFDQEDQVKLADSAKGLWQQITSQVEGWKEGLSSGLSEWLKRFRVEAGFVSWIIALLPFCVLGAVWYFRKSLRWLLFKCFGRPTDLDPRREEARRYLKRIAERMSWAESQNLVVPDDLIRAQSEMEAIRFGSEVSSKHAETSFQFARQALKRKLRPLE